ncbi:hypothetical protein BGW38_002114, partial [Lunasporangiospora selenospora]
AGVDTGASRTSLAEMIMNPVSLALAFADTAETTTGASSLYFSPASTSSTAAAAVPASECSQLLQDRDRKVDPAFYNDHHVVSPSLELPRERLLRLLRLPQAVSSPAFSYSDFQNILNHTRGLEKNLTLMPSHPYASSSANCAKVATTDGRPCAALYSRAPFAPKATISRRKRALRHSSWSNEYESSSIDLTELYPHIESPIDWPGEAYFSNSSDSDDSSTESDFVWHSSASLDQMSDEELMVEFGRTPRIFEDMSTMTFYISPMSISELATGLWTRSRPACVIINTNIPRGTRFDEMDWSPDALRMLHSPNAGGSSLLSEVLSCEMLHRCLGATLAKTEMEIRYLFAYQPITDYSVALPNLSPRLHVGVSVTRAFAFKGAYRREDCRKLLWKKLSGVLASTKNVVDERFFKQILHIWVPTGKVARTVQATYRTLPIDLTRNTIVIISVVNAPWVFTNRR